MTRTPLVLFDVNGTLSDMGRMSQHFEEVGAPGQMATLWFASLLRDAFALTAVGTNPAFSSVAEGALRAVLAGQHLNRPVDGAVAHVLAALQDLPVHADVPTGVAALKDSGIALATLTNGARSTAEGLLERAGIRTHFEAVLSVEDAPRWKPAPESYAYATETLQRAAADLVLVAVHPWDIDGAARAGLRTAWLNRDGASYPSALTLPDHEVSSITDLPAALAPKTTS